MSNRSPSGEPFRLAWDNLGRIYVEWLDRKGKQHGDPTNITIELWAVARRVIQEHGIAHMNLTAPIGMDYPKCLLFTETNKKTGRKQAFRITVEEISPEEDDEV